MARFLRFLLALAALPLCAALGRALWVAVFASKELNAAEGLPAGAIAFAGGFVAFFALLLVCPSPMRTYVLGHELTHALWGLAFGARVSNIKVAASGGSVMLSKSNVWITLAPYFFPFYTAVVALIALVVRIFVDPLPWPLAWIFAVGFTWCFHVHFTLHALFQRQPDVLEYGRLFSWAFIWIANTLGVLAVLCAATSLTCVHTASILGDAVRGAYSWTWECGVWLFRAIAGLFGNGA